MSKSDKINPKLGEELKAVLTSASFKKRHVLHAVIASFIFLVLWTPYRYLTPILISKGISIRSLDSLVKPLVKSGIVISCLRFLDRIPKNRYMQELGIRRKGLLKGIVYGAVTWLLYTLTLQCSTLYFVGGGAIHPRLRLTISDPIEYFLDLWYYILIVGLFEELLARGYILREFYKGIKLKFRGILSIIASGFLFSLFHLPIDVYVMKLGLVTILFHLLFSFSFSILAGYLFIRSGWHLASVIVLHGMMDVKPFFSLIPPNVQPPGTGKESVYEFFLSILVPIISIEGMHRGRGRADKFKNAFLAKIKA